MNFFNLIETQKNKRKVIIIKNQELFEIFIPGAGLFSKFTVLSLVAILFPTYLIQLFTISLTIANHQYIAPVLVWNILITVIACLIMTVAEFSQRRLSLTRNTICWQYYLFDFKLGYSQSEKVHSVNCVSNWNTAWHRKYLEIWTGRNKYEINTDNLGLFAVTSPELSAIAKELSDWLDLTVIQD